MACDACLLIMAASACPQVVSRRRSMTDGEPTCGVYSGFEIASFMTVSTFCSSVTYVALIRVDLRVHTMRKDVAISMLIWPYITPVTIGAFLSLLLQTVTRTRQYVLIQMDSYVAFMAI